MPCRYCGGRSTLPRKTERTATPSFASASRSSLSTVLCISARFSEKISLTVKRESVR